MISLMASQNFLFGIVLASALTGAACYILCGPSPSKIKRKKLNPPGLVNIGKSCFLNSILQAFASCQTINNWLETFTNYHQNNKDDIKISESKSLLLATFKLLKELNNQSAETKHLSMASTNDVVKALYSQRWVISNEEQDAHEMFHIFTTTMEDEIKTNVSSSSLSLDANGMTNGILSRCCDSLPTVTQTTGNFHTKLPFRGLLASQLRCESCSYKSPLKFDTFDSLSLPIPTRKWPHVMLQDCLRHYMMPERVKDVECERCTGALHTVPKTMAKSNFIKQLTIGKLPDLLCIHIQRMAWLDNGMPTKRYEHVIFPRYLNMSEFRIGYQSSSKTNPAKLNCTSLVGGSSETLEKSVEDKENSTIPTLNFSSSLTEWKSTTKPLMYSLQSVIVHLGDVHSGHFVTYRRGSLGSNHRNCWFMCSDANVYEVSFDQVLECDAYMLFYERTKIQKEM